MATPHVPSIYSWLFSIFLIFFAIAISIVYENGSNEHNTDLESALARVKTDSCKDELIRFAKSINRLKKPVHLKRSCPLDQPNVKQIQRLGCVSLTKSKHLIKIEESITELSSCLNLCFSYGHSQSGHHYDSSSCYCGDNEYYAKFKSVSCESEKSEKIGWYVVNNGIYYPPSNQTIQSELKKRDTSEIKIAFLLIVRGRSTLHIKRLLKNIYAKEHVYYIHVDKRDEPLFNDLLHLEENFPNIVIARSRFTTIWGGPSLLNMVLNALEQMTFRFRSWKYLINLSESDYPIKPLQSLEDYLIASDQNKPPIYLRSHNIKGYKFIKKQGLDRNFYQCDNRAWRIGGRSLPTGIVYSGGSDWFALPRDFCNYILRNLDNKEDLNLVQTLREVYNHTLLPVESFFHTVALNSEFCDRLVDNNLRITNWRRKHGCKCQHKNVVDWCGCSPLVYRSADWSKLHKSNQIPHLFFSRKFDPTISSSIIDRVERQLLATHSSPNSKQDSRFWQIALTPDDNSSQDQEVLRQFGKFSINQLKLSHHWLLKHGEPLAEELKLATVHYYFNEDRFVGYIYRYCGSASCLEMLVEKINPNAFSSEKNRCLLNGSSSLYAIEVNHGFDTGERLFRDFHPLNQRSSIVVYHEWLVGSEYSLNDSKSTELLSFTWLVARIDLKYVQEVKLKFSNRSTRLTLAHRLNIRRPLASGLWKLRISSHDFDCIDYRFLVFSEFAYTTGSVEQKDFNEFYSVTSFCLINNTQTSKTGSYSANNCLSNNWGTEGMKQWIEAKTISGYAI